MNRSLLFIAFTSSFCSMCYSMIMALLMGEFTGEEVLTQCLTLGPYLLGLGMGSAFGDRVTDESRLKQLFRLEWVSVTALPAVPLAQLLGVFIFINLSPEVRDLDSPQALTALLSITGVLAFGSGLLGGAQLPLILRLNKTSSTELILAVNYLGPLAAGIAIVLLSGHSFGFGLQMYIIGLVQIAGLVCLLIGSSGSKLSLVSLVLPLGILFASARFFPELEIRTVKSAYLRTRLNSWQELLNPDHLLRVLDQYGILERVRTSYQTIDLMVEPGEAKYGVPGNATLYLNRKPQFDVHSVRTYHETMVDGSINLMERVPESVLVLGAGDGLLLSELRRFPEIKKIVMVELDEKMLEWSRNNSIISDMNGQILRNIPANSEILTMDAVSFLRGNRNRFDLILVDFPFPNGHELAKLYSREFYELVRRSLSSDGMVMIDLPLYIEQGGELSRESQTIIRTLAAAGFSNRLMIGPTASFVAVKTGGEPLKFHYEKFPPELSLPTAMNLVAPFPEVPLRKDLPVNTMFWPRGL